MEQTTHMLDDANVADEIVRIGSTVPGSALGKTATS